LKLFGLQPPHTLRRLAMEAVELVAVAVVAKAVVAMASLSLLLALVMLWPRRHPPRESACKSARADRVQPVAAATAMAWSAKQVGRRSRRHPAGVWRLGRLAALSVTPASFF
jgi:hypothetical protein